MSNAVIWNEKSLANAVQAAASLALFTASIENVLKTNNTQSPEAVREMFRAAEKLAQRGILAAT